MFKKILFLLDLEGVNNIVGTPYSGLVTTDPQYKVATKQAALEVNTAADALFKIGVEKIDLWDNHGGGNNVDPADLDTRIILLNVDLSLPRMYFAGENEYDAVCYFGYHTMEGTLGGVLAHTMNSAINQYYKLNGQYIGEIDIDSYIAASYGIPSCFFSAGDITCSQAKKVLPHIVTVVTKKELSRNEAEFRDNEELFSELREKICQAITKEIPLKNLDFPATMEKSFKRTEDAEKYLYRLKSNNIEADYLSDDILGKDAHTVVSTIHNISEFIKSI